ncbi:MAG: glycosyltransferase family 39 protein [Armatimonadota bacterium]
MSTKMQQISERILWPRVFATVGIFVALGVVLSLYYVQAFSGLTQRDQIDIAQIARSVSSGGGFTTHFIRPFNVELLKNATSPLPEVNHGPLYPYAVAAVFKFMGPSEQAVVWVSMIFMFLTFAGTYLLGKMLFDWRTGIFAAANLGVGAAVLRVGIGASEWPMAAFWLVLLMMTVAAHHRRCMNDSGARIAFPIFAGVLIAALYMTNHALMILGIPIAVYFAVTGDKHWRDFAVFAVVAVIACGPWAYRNAVHTGGSILGANAWDVMVDTKIFPGDTFYRGVNDSVRGIARVVLYPMEQFSSFSEKLMDGTSDAVAEGIPMLGLIMLPFAVVSMLYRFKSPAANAVRGLFYGIVPALCFAIALFSLNRDAFVLVAPLAAVFGGAYFFLLLDAKKLHPVFQRGVIIAVMLLAFWPSLTMIVWGSHKTEDVDDVTRLLTHSDTLGIECLYTDVPWSAAWMSRSMVAVWLPRSDNDISEMDVEGFPMNVVILTPECRRLDINETWYKLYTMKLERQYIENPDEVLERIRAYGEELGRNSDDADMMKRFFRQNQRNANVYNSIMGFKQADLGLLATDQVQVYQRSDE